MRVATGYEHRTLAAAGWLLLVVCGCRASDVVLPKKEMGTIYDTAYEKTLNSGKAIPLLDSWREDAPVYAEPVAICGWQDGVSTWEVLFATNRAIEPADPVADRAHFGNTPLATPLYGSAEITLPRRRRGVDTPVKPPTGIRLLGGSTKSDSADDLATLDKVQASSAASFLEGVRRQVARSRQHDVLLFVHGFNVSFDDAVVRAAQVALDMPFNGAVVAYSWPSQGGIQNYGKDEPINFDSVPPFLEFLTMLRTGLDDEARIHILVHSMGNRIVLRGLSEWQIDRGTPTIDNLALLAPDVGLSDFQAWGPRAAACCRRVTLYASIHDAALIASKGLHAEQRAGDAHPPVIVRGIETVDCSAVDATSFLGHGYYSANIDVLADLFMLIKRNRSAAERPHLREKTTSEGSYWKWTSAAPHDLWTWHFDDLASRN